MQMKRSKSSSCETGLALMSNTASWRQAKPAAQIIRISNVDSETRPIHMPFLLDTSERTRQAKNKGKKKGHDVDHFTQI